MKKNHEIWEKMEGESAKAYYAFTVYRDQDPLSRSIREVGRKLDRSRQLLGVWSTKWRWVERVAAYDAFLDAIQSEEAEAERREMGRRQARDGKMLQEIGISALRHVMGPDGQVAKGQISDTLAAKLVEIGVKIERLARGESTENSEQKNLLVIRIPEVIEDVDEWKRTYKPSANHQRLVPATETGSADKLSD